MPERPRHAIITGASSGIGAATALELAKAGWAVSIGARREDRLAETREAIEKAGGRVSAHPLDVTDLESVRAFCVAAEAELGPTGLLVNNAGQNLSALIAESTADELRADVEVNLLGAMWMTRELVPGMIERRVGDVVFIASDSARRPRPYQGAYGAAKAGLEVFAQVLEMETEGTGVRSIVVRVGPTGSEFGNQMPRDKIHRILESWKYWGVYRRLHYMPGESVAKAIVRTISAPVEESYPTVVDVQPGGRSREFSDPDEQE